MPQINIEGFEDKLIDAGAGAYAGLDPRIRAKLKSCMMVLHRFWGETAFVRRTTVYEQDNGYSLGEHVKPRPWAMFAVDEEYASAPGLISAVMPAILAKVPNLFPCLLSQHAEPSLSEPVSAALELLGLEEVYSLNYYEAVKMVQNLVSLTGPDSGSVVLLGAKSAFADIAGQCLQHRLSTMTLPARMRLGIEPGCEVDTDFIAWAYPHAELEILTPESDMKGFFAIATNKAGEYSLTGLLSGGTRPRLLVRPGYEHLWIWPRLGPDFFCSREISIF